MRIIYVADDSTQFDNIYDCEIYEDFLRYSAIKKIIFYDKDGSSYLIDSIAAFTDDAIYNKAEKVLIHNDEEYEAFNRWADDRGYCEFTENINAPGTWIRQSNDNNFSDACWIKAE